MTHDDPCAEPGGCGRCTCGAYSEAPATCDDCGRPAPLTRLGDAHAGQDLCPDCYATARLDVDAQGERI